MAVSINLPLTQQTVKSLHAGDIVEISGCIYTARDAAHKKMTEEFNQTGKFPFDIMGAVVYYAGPSPAKHGEAIGSVGPTTSYRMDSYAPMLIEKGQMGMIGKGMRSKEVVDAMIKFGAVYFGATGGAGALLASHVVKSEIVAYHNLGAEAIRRLTVSNFPAIVVIDCYGNNLYETEPQKYKK